MLPSRLWASMGADVTQLRALLQVRLMLDNRQPRQWGKNSGTPTKYRIWGMALISAFTGVLYLFPLVAFRDHIAGWTIYYTAFGFLYVFTLITDLSHVLLDTKEKYIVQTRPVTDRTLLLARLLHLFSYLLRTALPMSLGGWGMAIYFSGIKGALWFPVTMLLLLLMVVFVVNLFYIALLRFVKPSRFNTLLSYFQIGFAIILFASYQFLPRLFGTARLEAFDLSQYGIVRIFPAYWLAATWGWMGVPVRLSGGTGLGLLAFALPLVCLIVLVRVLAPQFSRRLALIDSQGESAAPAAKTSGKATSGTPPVSWGTRLARVFTRSRAGEAGFLISWALTGRSRSFRMRMITSLAYLPVYFVYIISTSSRSLPETLERLPQTNTYLMLLYMISFVVMQSVSYLAMSDTYKAAWIYRTTPLQHPGRLILGSVTAVWVKYILPFFTALSLVVLGIWGARVLPDVLLAAFNIASFGLVTLRLTHFYLPFSLPEKAEANKGALNILRIVLAFLIPLVLGGLHYLALSFLWLKLLFMGLSAAFFWLVWTGLQERGWAFLDKTYRNLES